MNNQNLLTKKWDYIVVGSGPGGAVTAYEVAKTGASVLVIEQGSSLSIDNPEPYTSGEMINKYKNSGMTVAIGKPVVSYVEGRTLGGGSEVNSGIYYRPPAQILEVWKREFNLESCQSKDLEEHSLYIERTLNVSQENRDKALLATPLIEGSAKLDWKVLNPPKWIKNGKRQSMTETFLKAAIDYGLEIAPNTEAIKIKRNKDSWRVYCKQNGVNFHLSCQYLFLSAGAIQTPSLLQKSGFTKNVGKQLRLHPSFKATAIFDSRINDLDGSIPAIQIKEFAPRFSIGCSVSTQSHLAMSLVGQSQISEILEQNISNMGSYYTMISGTSKGNILSLPFISKPLVFYQINQDDIKILREAIDALVNVLFSAGAKKIFTSLGVFESKEEYSAIDEKKFKKLLTSQAKLMTIHLTSSVPMGEDTSKCAVNSFGQFHGQKNLFVNDSSMLCGSPSVNPQGTIMAIARRNILHHLRSK